MHLTAQLPSGYGIEPGSWRWPGETPEALTSGAHFAKAAKVAERGKFDAFFIADIPGITDEIASAPPLSSGLDPVVLLSIMAAATEKVGLVATLSTTFAEPFTIARQFRSLDLISQGRIGWNVVTTGRPFALLNYFPGLPSSPDRHARAREVVEAVFQLWDSWPEDAWVLNTQTGEYADANKIREINYRGRHVASRGPLVLPPSPQGRPVIFTAGGGQSGFDFACEHADAVYGNPFSQDDATHYWQALSQGTAAAGRTPDSLRVFSGVITSVASTEREALERRQALDELGDVKGRQAYLGHMIGLPTSDLPLDAPIPSELMDHARANPQDPRSFRALELAHQGFTLREIIAHGPINYHPVALGTPDQVADMLQSWFEAGIGRGFNITPDSGLTALEDFTDQVIPILQKRGLFRSDYAGQTLRDHLGLSGT